jgi:isopropylmalate/homocitrate/citramalate synthase
MNVAQPWRTDDWWVSPFDYEGEVTGGLDLPDDVILHDETLRDGEQTPGVVFRKEEKVRIAKLIDGLGVRRMNVALPAVSAEDAEAVKEITKLGLDAEVFVLSRAMKADIDLAVDCGVDGLIFEVPVGVPRLELQFKHWSEDDVIQKSVENIRYARSKGLRVVFFLMDSSRADLGFLDRLIERVVKEAPPDSVALVDTTGCMSPQATAWLVARMRDLSGLPIEIHTHNDMGLAVGNSMAAVGAGASVVHVSVGGIGERTGNTPLEEAAVALRVLYGLDPRISLDRLSELTREVTRIAGFNLAPNKPIAGARTFTRESGMGIEMLKDQPLGLYCLHPRLVGQQARYLLGKKSGNPSVAMKLEDLELTASEDDVGEILRRVKELGMSKKGPVTDDEFRDIHAAVTAAS